MYETEKLAKGRELLQEFESTIKIARAKALSKESLERPLNDNELKQFREAIL